MDKKNTLYTEAINEMLLGITESDDVTKILQTMVDIMGMTLKVDRSLIYDIDFTANVADGLCEWLNPALPELTPSIGKYPLDLFKVGCFWLNEHKTWLESHFDNVNKNLVNDGSGNLLHNQMFIKSLIWFPFDFHSDRFYLLVFNQVENKRVWKQEEIDFMKVAAKQVIVALKKVRMLKALSESQKHLLFEQSLFTSGPVVVFRWQAAENWPVEYVSDNVSQFGYSVADLITGRVPFATIVHPEDIARVAEEVISHSKAGVASFEQEYRIILGDGSIRYIYDFTKIIRNHEGNITHYHGYVFDISDRKKAEDALFEEKEQALVTLHSIGDGVITTDVHGVVRFINPIAEQLTGWSNSDAEGKSLKEIFPIYNEKTGIETKNPVDIVLEEKRIVAMANHTVLRNKKGMEIAIEDSAAPIRNKEGDIVGVVMVFHDVVEARKLAKKLEWQASHDALTELFSRREFEKRVNDVLSLDKLKNKGCLLYLDLDQFKIINDTCGHAAGDQLLKQLPTVMQKELDGESILARLGGDEFGILLVKKSLEEAKKIAEKLIHSIHSFHFVFGEQVFEIGVSIGLVEIRDQTLGTLLSQSDMACYMAKDTGRNRYHVYHEKDEEIAKRQVEMEWVSRLNRGLEENRFKLFHQEIVALQSGNGKSRHFEILLRLENEDKKIIKPGEFLSAAERYNLMLEIDKWVINSTFEKYATNQKKYLEKDVSFSINLSGVSLSDHSLLDYLKERISHYEIPPAQFCLEITETAAIANLNKIYKLMVELKKLGILFSLDDFGSGLSSYAYLKHLPVDFIKIDGNFVSDIMNDKMDEAIVESINYLGHSMNLKTIAEFVVEPEIKKKLKKMGVDYAQGYAIHRPESLENLIL